MPTACHNPKRRRSITAQLLAFLIITPFAIAFIYAGIHEYRRYRSAGRANYGLVFDEETGTTHVTGIAEGQEAYDPDAFDPGEYNDPEGRTAPDEDTPPSDGPADDPDAPQKPEPGSERI